MDIYKAHLKADNAIFEVFNDYQKKYSDKTIYYLLGRLEESIQCYKRVITEKGA